MRQLLTAALLSSAVAVACGPAAGDAKKPAKKNEKTGEVVATIGGDKVTIEDLQHKLEEQSPFVRARYAEADKKQELLDSQVRFEVLAHEAETRGYADDPEVEEAVKKIIVQKLTREEFDGRVQLKDITDAELQTYFEAHKADYQKPEMVRASVITVAGSAGGATDKGAAKKAIDEAHKQASDPKKKDDRNAWKDLVTKVSTDEASKPAGGDLRYLSREDAVTRFGQPAADWLFSSDEQNAVSPVFEHKEALHLFKRTGKRKAIERSFDQVKNQIKNVVYREKRTAAFNAFIDELRTKYGVKTFPEKLSLLKIDVNPAALQGEGGDDGHGHGSMGQPPAPPAPPVGDDDDDAPSGPPGSPTGAPKPKPTPTPTPFPG